MPARQPEPALRRLCALQFQIVSRYTLIMMNDMIIFMTLVMITVKSSSGILVRCGK